MLIPAFVVVLLFFTCLLIVYRFYMKREMRKALGIEVNHAISQYVALSEKSDRD